MKTFYQWALIALTALSLLRNLYTDYNGVKEREPFGFGGSVASVAAAAIYVALLYGAGALSNL
jgi:hypothetical protein